MQHRAEIAAPPVYCDFEQNETGEGTMEVEYERHFLARTFRGFEEMEFRAYPESNTEF